MWDNASVLVVNLLGAAGVLACWLGSATQTTWHAEMPWLDGAITAAIVVVISDAIWLLGGMNKMRSGRRDLILRAGEVRSAAARDLAERGGAVRVLLQGADRSRRTYVTAPRMTFYHDPSCLFASGKSTSSLTAEEAESSGLRRCPVCLR